MRKGFRPILWPIGPSIAYLQLTKGMFSLIDADCIPLLVGKNCYISIQGYALTARKRVKIQIHRLLMKPPADMQVDHINGNPLDNRKSNLRLCTAAQNAKNRRVNKTSATGFRGVYYETRLKQYRAYMYVDGRRMHLGLARTPEAAHAIHESKSIELIGEFTRNFREIVARNGVSA